MNDVSDIAACPNGVLVQSNPDIYDQFFQAFIDKLDTRIISDLAKQMRYFRIGNQEQEVFMHQDVYRILRHDGYSDSPHLEDLTISMLKDIASAHAGDTRIVMGRSGSDDAAKKQFYVLLPVNDERPNFDDFDLAVQHSKNDNYKSNLTKSSHFAEHAFEQAYK
jgi:hypothetical protein